MPTSIAVERRSSAHPFVVPFGIFAAFLILNQLLETAWPDARFLVYPLQTLVCGYALWHYRLAYGPLRARGLGFGAITGVLVLCFWVAPQLFGFAPPRTGGFNPERLAAFPGLYALTLAVRFLRLVIVVPILEEVFWRACVLRILIRPDLSSVPFGAFSWSSCLATAGLFAIEHQPPDWPAGFLAGLLYNAVAYRTRNLGACIFGHALTNLGLGIYICATRQWGFW
ncbi:MAG: CAAX prenyl protease-related protein [Verrucomicrobia bacterium]|nr:CAAX prenyl protease-related protein [Verrucomicrobiota bacterium]